MDTLYGPICLSVPCCVVAVFSQFLEPLHYCVGLWLSSLGIWHGMPYDVASSSVRINIWLCLCFAQRFTIVMRFQQQALNTHSNQAHGPNAVVISFNGISLNWSTLYWILKMLQPIFSHKTQTWRPLNLQWGYAAKHLTCNMSTTVWEMEETVQYQPMTYTHDPKRLKLCLKIFAA